MRNIKIRVEYDGGAYCGWQVQPGQKTIQGMLESAIEKLTGTFSRVEGSGRTDRGVHALGQVAHFFTPFEMPNIEFASALNAHLPKDISVRECREVDSEFHARFSAQAKTYMYEVENSRTRPVLDRHRVWWVSWDLDLPLMRQATKYIVGSHDFSSFTDASRSGEGFNNVRTVRRADWSVDGDRLRFEIEGEGFLYKMVRCLVGTLVEVGRARIVPDDIPGILDAKNRQAAGPTAPPQGLCLMNVEYPHQNETGE